MRIRDKLPLELVEIGRNIHRLRRQSGFSQQQLAAKAELAQSRISAIEKGQLLPTLPQLVRLAHALAVPLQWFLTGTVTPGSELADIAFQLQWLGLVDLFVPNARVPGAFLPTEQVLALAVEGSQPNPRILEAIPALLAWAEWSPPRLHDYARPKGSKTHIRLGWLADVALTIDRTQGFPGGCPARRRLEQYLRPFEKINLFAPDSLGRPGVVETLPLVSQRWKITYDTTLATFAARAAHLDDLRRRELPSSPRGSDHG